MHSNHRLWLLVVSNKYNPNHVTERNDYFLAFTNKFEVEKKIEETAFDIIIIDGTVSSELPQTLKSIQNTLKYHNCMQLCSLRD